MLTGLGPPLSAVTCAGWEDKNVFEIHQPTQISRSRSSHKEQMKAVGGGCLLQADLLYFQVSLGFWLQTETLN